MALVVAAWLASRRSDLRGAWSCPAAGAARPRAARSSAADRTGSGCPGPYLAGAEQRSVDAETVAVAQWAGPYLPDGLQRRRRRDVQPGACPNFADGHHGDPAGGLRQRDADVHRRSRSTRRSLRADPPQRGRLRRRRHPAGRADRAVRAASSRAAPATATPPRPSQREQVRQVRRGSPASTSSSTARSRSTTSARCAACRRPFEDRTRPGLPGTWTPWQVGVPRRSCCWSGSCCAAGCSTCAGSAPATPGGPRWCCRRRWSLGAIGVARRLRAGRRRRRRRGAALRAAPAQPSPARCRSASAGRAWAWGVPDRAASSAGHRRPGGLVDLARAARRPAAAAAAVGWRALVRAARRAAVGRAAGRAIEARHLVAVPLPAGRPGRRPRCSGWSSGCSSPGWSTPTRSASRRPRSAPRPCSVS